MGNVGQAFSPSPEYLAEQEKMRELRSRPWKEATDSERIEKLKMLVEDFNYLNSSIASLQAEVHRLKAHSHKEDGTVMVKISDVNINGIGGLVGASRLNPLL